MALISMPPPPCRYPENLKREELNTVLPFCDALPVHWPSSVVVRVGRAVCIMVHVTLLLYAENASWCVTSLSTHQ